MMRALLIAFVMVARLTGPVAAHYQWQNGEPVPSWVKTLCCGRADAHLLEPSDVWRDGDGAYHVKGNGAVVPSRLALPSQDGRYWAFYATYPDGTQSIIYCLFVPAGI